jgi:hypothetical protein
MKGPPVSTSWVGFRAILDMMTKRKTLTQIIQPVANHFIHLDFLTVNNNYQFEWGRGRYL